jgi:hypothetical protein
MLRREPPVGIHHLAADQEGPGIRLESRDGCEEPLECVRLRQGGSVEQPEPFSGGITRGLRLFGDGARQVQVAAIEHGNGAG